MPDDNFRSERIFKGPGFAETLYLGTIGSRRVIRKASNPDAFTFSRTALVREIRLLERIPDELRPYFPRLIDTNLGGLPEDAPDLPDIIYYDMPYYTPEDGWRTLSTCFIEGCIEKSEAHRIIDGIVDAAFLCFSLDRRKPDDEYAERTMLASIRESLAWASEDTEFRRLMDMKNLSVNGRPIRNIPALVEYFQDTERMRSLLTPRIDRFLHGDFFPENILYNTKTGQWLLMDPVSVRGVHRGDFVLDLNKMDDWLSGELPALRMGKFTVEIDGSGIRLDIHRREGELANLHSLGLHDRYRERLRDRAYADVFAVEQGWETRWLYVKAFYCFCMLPLAENRQAVARLFLALDTMADFLERGGAP